MKKQHIISLLVLTATLAFSFPAQASDEITPAEARAIAKEAFIYGYPMVETYRIQFAYFALPGNPEYKGPFNQIVNIPRVYTPEDTAIQTPNSDTPYSFIGGDLRAEPLVLTVPAIEKDRYYSIQFIDAYTHNFAYAGTRTTGNGAGKFLLVGPGWKGEKPAGIKEVIHSETDLVFIMFRTQVFGSKDLENVKKIQAGYKVQPLSEFLGMPAPAAAPKLNFVKPLTMDGANTSLEVFNVLNFILTYCPTVPSEKTLLARFAKIGVGAGLEFDGEKLSPELKQAMKDGIADGWNAYKELLTTEINTGKVTSGDLFGTREFLKNNDLYRMAAAVLGIYGNSKIEAMYPVYRQDDNGEKLNAAGNTYTLHFAKGEFPAVNAFWSLTMYELPSSLLTANPIDRYLINSPMLPDLKPDPDGGVTIYIQHTSPGKEEESNWLPAPKGPFWLVLRLYSPKEEAISGKWIAPKIKKVE